MEPDELEDYFSDKFSSISVKTSGTLADIAAAVVSKPFFGLKEGDTVALKSPKEPCKSSIERFVRESEILEMLMQQEVSEIITYYGCLTTPEGIPVLVEEKRGITLRAKVVNDAVVVNSCRDIHARFRTKGCYNIQMLKIDEKTVIPFEINPRVSTTFCLGVAAGIDPIENYYSKSNSDESGVFKENISLKRYWINYIQ